MGDAEQGSWQFILARKVYFVDISIILSGM